MGLNENVVNMTSEQLKVSEINKKGIYTVRAVAGSGKTFTAIQYMKKHKNETILYLVYNTSNRKELKEKLKKERINNVDVHTIHSFIYGKTISQAKKGKGNFFKKYGNLEVGNGPVVDEDFCNELDCDYYQAVEALEIYNKYLSSNLKASEIIELEVRKMLDVTTENQVEIKVAEVIKRFKKINNLFLNGIYEISHDFYIKWYANNGDEINVYDTLIVDEAQDTSGAMLQIIEKINSPKKILIGDSEQLIYEWRGAINSLEAIKILHSEKVKQLELTHSFRVGKQIAELAEILCQNRVVGKNSNNIIVENLEDVLHKKHHTIMGIKNAEIFKFYVENLNRYKNIKIFYRNRDFRQLYSLINFIKGNNEKVNDSILLKLSSFKELLYVTGLDDDISFIVNNNHLRKLNDISSDWGMYLTVNYKTYALLLRTYGVSLLEFAVNNILRTTVKKETEDFDVMFTTVHTSKGREYPNLIFLKDYYIDEILLNGIKDRKTLSEIVKLKRSEDTDVEHLNVLYVGITRAVGRVYFQSDLIRNLLFNRVD